MSQLDTLGGTSVPNSAAGNPARDAAPIMPSPVRLRGTHAVHGCALLLGTRRLFANRYRLVRQLGTGGNSVVYLADDKLTGEQVALKVFVNRAGISRDRLEAAIRPEIVLSRKVSHEGVCRVYDLGRAGHELFLTMQFVPGRTVQDLLSAGRVDLRTAFRIMHRALRALGAIHNAGVIHRDLKPSNIMVGDDGRVTLVDFGLAADISAGPELNGVPLGTPKYCAPEQLAGQRATVASDIYSFGLVAQEVCDAAYAGQVPAKIQAVLARCLEKNAEKRFRNADEVRIALRKASQTGRVLSQIRRSVGGLLNISG